MFLNELLNIPSTLFHRNPGRNDMIFDRGFGVLCGNAMKTCQIKCWDLVMPMRPTKPSKVASNAFMDWEQTLLGHLTR